MKVLCFLQGEKWLGTMNGEPAPARSTVNPGGFPINLRDTVTEMCTKFFGSMSISVSSNSSY